MKFFIEENEFDPTKTIEVDLAKNTSTVPPAQWAAQVECDHGTAGGYTTIGPRFHAGPYVGAVYLAQRLVQQYASVLASWPTAPDEIYQYQAVLRADNGNVARYHGFKVRVLGASSGSRAHIGFVRVGQAGPAGGRPEARWIDLDDPDVCDPAANGFTTITPSSAPGTVGALFLRSEVMAAAAPNQPKIPRHFGW